MTLTIELASSPGPSQILSPRFYLAAVEKNWEKAWDQNYVTDRKWWTWLVRNVATIDLVLEFLGVIIEHNELVLIGPRISGGDN